MRVPLSWLRDYVDLELEPEALAERLTLLGMEVQAIERRGDDWRGILVGELTAVEPHPNSDKLLLARARLGDGRADLSIVTGAMNVAVGQHVPVAAPGAVLPGGRRIEVATLAGTESEGMLCSGAELGLTPDAEGILVLPDDAPVGTPVEDLYAEVVLDIDVKPNRGDALSLVGVAREVAAATGASVRFPPTDPPESGDETADHLAVEVAERSLCSRFVARYLDGIRGGPSPFEVQVRLTAAGLRPVSSVVDATNYVMVELGKPTHAFDAARIAGGRIVVRPARSGERLETLDHVVRELGPETLLIADPSGPLAIAGVIGGAQSEVGEGTQAVIIESAIFDPVSIRRTRQRYGLPSEASLRFEKGQEWRLARLGADRVARLIAEWSGARVAQGVVDTDPSEPAPIRFAFRPARVARLIGVEIDASEMADLLGRVGVATEPAGRDATVPVIAEGPPVPAEGAEALLATIPSHRRDLVIEADLAEEVARVRGYETVPARRPETPMPGYRREPQRLLDELRELLSGRGLSEIVTHALRSVREHQLLGIGDDDPATIRVTNPVSAEHVELRRSLLPGLVRTLAFNERQRREQLAVFEIGDVHRWHGGRPVEERRLGIVLAGPWQLQGWDQPARPADVSDAKGIVEWLAERSGLGSPVYQSAEPLRDVEHPTRVAAILAGADARTALGRVGELDPRYLGAAEVRAERVAFAELDLAAFTALVPERIRMADPPRRPPVERDLAVVVSEERPAGEVAATIRSAAGELLRELRLFDRYHGPSVGPEEVSLAYRLRLQAPDRTLTDEEVDRLVGAVVRALEERLGARIRS
ncbi:MAG TPA: phenylalanine--tRNA ligase subunit beta [Candidatus Limnocylindrales bacterium]|jgi:phenylalanyl-tRNA synthetase beta chain|nr:phenylalanine--tRNA ligase subunit beta [Candidatus Limnocylindrales bacterium]